MMTDKQTRRPPESRSAAYRAGERTALVMMLGAAIVLVRLSMSRREPQAGP